LFGGPVLTFPFGIIPSRILRIGATLYTGNQKSVDLAAASIHRGTVPLVAIPPNSRLIFITVWRGEYSTEITSLRFFSMD
jgi:hypothetical protein